LPWRNILGTSWLPERLLVGQQDLSSGLTCQKHVRVNPLSNWPAVSNITFRPSDHKDYRFKTGNSPRLFFLSEMQFAELVSWISPLSAYNSGAQVSCAPLWSPQIRILRVSLQRVSSPFQLQQNSSGSETLTSRSMF
jgi:hypothetical protein